MKQYNMCTEISWTTWELFVNLSLFIFNLVKRTLKGWLKIYFPRLAKHLRSAQGGPPVLGLNVVSVDVILLFRIGIHQAK